MEAPNSQQQQMPPPPSAPPQQQPQMPQPPQPPGGDASSSGRGGGGRGRGGRGNSRGGRTGAGGRTLVDPNKTGRGGRGGGRGGRGSGEPGTVQKIAANTGIPYGHVPAYLPGSSSLVEELDQRIMIVLRDGRHLVGVSSLWRHLSVFFRGSDGSFVVRLLCIALFAGGSSFRWMIRMCWRCDCCNHAFMLTLTTIALDRTTLPTHAH